MIALLLFLILVFLVLRSLSIMTLEAIGAVFGLLILLIAYFVRKRKGG